MKWISRFTKVFFSNRRIFFFLFKVLAALNNNLPHRGSLKYDVWKPHHASRESEENFMLDLLRLYQNASPLTAVNIMDQALKRKFLLGINPIFAKICLVLLWLVTVSWKIVGRSNPCYRILPVMVGLFLVLQVRLVREAWQWWERHKKYRKISSKHTVEAGFACCKCFTVIYDFYTFLRHFLLNAKFTFYWFGGF